MSEITIRLLVSDGDPTTWPAPLYSDADLESGINEDSFFVVSDSKRAFFSEKFGQHFKGKHNIQAEKVHLEIPKGYVVVMHYKRAGGGGSKTNNGYRTDPYIFGHPKGSRFRSTNEILPHLDYLSALGSAPFIYKSSETSRDYATPATAANPNVVCQCTYCSRPAKSAGGGGKSSGGMLSGSRSSARGDGERFLTEMKAIWDLEVLRTRMSRCELKASLSLPTYKFRAWEMVKAFDPHSGSYYPAIVIPDDDYRKFVKRFHDEERENAPNYAIEFKKERTEAESAHLAKINEKRERELAIRQKARMTAQKQAEKEAKRRGEVYVKSQTEIDEDELSDEAFVQQYEDEEKDTGAMDMGLAQSFAARREKEKRETRDRFVEIMTSIFPPGEKLPKKIREREESGEAYRYTVASLDLPVPRIELKSQRMLRPYLWQQAEIALDEEFRSAERIAKLCSVEFIFPDGNGQVPLGATDRTKEETKSYFTLYYGPERIDIGTLVRIKPSTDEPSVPKEDDSDADLPTGLSRLNPHETVLHVTKIFTKATPIPSAPEGTPRKLTLHLSGHLYTTQPPTPDAQDDPLVPPSMLLPSTHPLLEISGMLTWYSLGAQTIPGARIAGRWYAPEAVEAWATADASSSLEGDKAMRTMAPPSWKLGRERHFGWDAQILDTVWRLRSADSESGTEVFRFADREYRVPSSKGLEDGINAFGPGNEEDDLEAADDGGIWEWPWGKKPSQTSSQHTTTTTNKSLDPKNKGKSKAITTTSPDRDLEGDVPMTPAPPVPVSSGFTAINSPPAAVGPSVSPGGRRLSRGRGGKLYTSPYRSRTGDIRTFFEKEE